MEEARKRADSLTSVQHTNKVARLCGVASGVIWDREKSKIGGRMQAEEIDGGWVHVIQSGEQQGRRWSRSRE